MKKGLFIVFSLFFLTITPVLFGAEEGLVQFLLRVDNLKVLQKAGFNQEQIGRIKEWQENARDNFRNTQKAEAGLKMQIQNEMKSKNPDIRKLENLLDKSHEMKKKTELAGLKLIIKVRYMLGEEKFARLVKAVKQRVDNGQENNKKSKAKQANKQKDTKQHREKDNENRDKQG
jgi:hypothetical protein